MRFFYKSSLIFFSCQFFFLDAHRMKKNASMENKIKNENKNFSLL